MTLPVDVLLVRGAPGVGKSSAVERLRAKIPDGAIIEVDTLRRMHAAVQWSGSVQHVRALEHAALLACSFMKQGIHPVVIVDNFSKGKLVEFTVKLTGTYRVISLYARPDVLMGRLEQRPSGEFKSVEASLRLNEEIWTERFPLERLLDTSLLTSDEVTSLLHDALLGKQWTCPPPPKNLFIEITTECDLRCRQCHLWRTTEPSTALSTSGKLQLIHELSDWARDATVVLTGGETLRKRDEFFALTKACRQLGLSSGASTNGTGIDDELVDRLLVEGPRFLVISLDSSRETLHDWIRGVRGTFKQVTTAIRRLVQRRREAFPDSDVQILTNTVVFDRNLKELTDYVEFAESLGVDGVMFQVLSRTFANTGPNDAFFERHFPRDISLFDSVIDSLLERQARGARIRTSSNDFQWMKRYVRNPDFIGEQVCASGDKNMMVDQHGDVQLCFAMRELTEGRSLGNVRRQGLRSLWESALAEIARGIMGACQRNCGMLNCHRREC